MPAPQTGSPMTYMLNGKQYWSLRLVERTSLPNWSPTGWLSKLLPTLWRGALARHPQACPPPRFALRRDLVEARWPCDAERRREGPRHTKSLKRLRGVSVTQPALASMQVSNQRQAAQTAAAPPLQIRPSRPSTQSESRKNARAPVIGNNIHSASPSSRAISTGDSSTTMPVTAIR